MDTHLTGTRIASQRRRFGWTQQDLAVRVGVAASTIWRWERNKVRPSKLAVAKLQQTLTDGSKVKKESQGK